MGVSIGWAAVQGETLDVWLKSEEFVRRTAEWAGVEVDEVTMEDASEFIRSSDDYYDLSPYFDSGVDERVFGIAIQSAYDYYSEVNTKDWKFKCDQAIEKMKEDFGFTNSTLYVGPDVC